VTVNYARKSASSQGVPAIRP